MQREARYHIKKNKNGEFLFMLMAPNGEVMLTSETFLNMPAALNGIETVRKNSSQEDRYSNNTTSNGKLFFYLKAVNNQIIGVSPIFESSAGLNHAIASVKKYGKSTLLVIR